MFEMIMNNYAQWGGLYLETTWRIRDWLGLAIFRGYRFQKWNDMIYIY